MREQIKKGQRFDILKRDGFTCQYCGRKPPVVILHVDHILAVALGGSNDDDNLLTSCSDCNLGKSAKPVDRIAAPVVFNFEEREDRMNQLKAYQKFLSEQNTALEGWVEKICCQWAIHDGQDPFAGKWTIPDELEDAVRQFVKRLPMQEILDAINIAFSRYPTAGENYRFKFFCGVCWRKIRQAQEKIQPK